MARIGVHLWAERYDRVTDIFAIQDEITKTIVEQLKVRQWRRDCKRVEMLFAHLHWSERQEGLLSTKINSPANAPLVADFCNRIGTSRKSRPPRLTAA